MSKSPMDVYRHNPWAKPFALSPTGYTVVKDADSRMRRMRDTEDVELLLRMAGWPHTQPAVRRAIHARLKELGVGA